jgi:hypothetical protein
MVTSHCGLYTNKAGALEIITEFSVWYTGHLRRESA